MYIYWLIAHKKLPHKNMHVHNAWGWRNGSWHFIPAHCQIDWLIDKHTHMHTHTHKHIGQRQVESRITQITLTGYEYDKRSVLWEYRNKWILSVSLMLLGRAFHWEKACCLYEYIILFYSPWAQEHQEMTRSLADRREWDGLCHTLHREYGGMNSEIEWQVFMGTTISDRN